MSINTTDAFTRCARHPQDPTILITDDPAMFPALGHPECKAIIWQRDLTDDVRSVIARLSVGDILGIHERFSQRKGKRFDPRDAVQVFLTRKFFESDEDSQVMGRDIEMITRHAMTAVSGYDYPYSWFHGHLTITPKYHVDTIDVVRCSTVYTGRGMRYLPCQLSDDDYAAAITKDVYLDPDDVEQRYPMDEVRPGDVIISKSSLDGRAYGGGQQLVHSSVKQQDGDKRLFMGIDLYKPTFDPVS